MHSLKRQSSVWLFLLVFVTSLLGVTFASTLPVYADQNAQWVDKVTIVIGTTRYVDSDPFDELDYYAGNYKGDKCPDSIRIDNMTAGGDSGGTSATLQKSSVVGDTGNCAPAGEEHVTLSNQSSRWVTAYQLDADHIFMPVYRSYDGTSGGAASTSHPSNNGLFQRFDKQNPECTGDNAGNVVSDNSIDNGKCAVFSRSTNGQLDIVPPKPNNSSVWINTNQTDSVFYGCPALLVNGGKCKFLFQNIVFANSRNFTQPPAVAAYNVTGTVDKATPDGGTAPPSCASNNSDISISWLVCGVIDALDKAVETSIAAVESLLSFNGEDFSKDPGIHTIWSLFRAIASFSLLGIALVMIIGQAIGGGE